MIHRKNSQTGFTIIELTISMVIFSLILLLIVSGVLHFTNSYYKGINSSNTQTTTRAALDTISQAIQFGGTTVASNGTTFCAGGKNFAYTLGLPVNGTPSATNWGLYELDSPGCATPPTPTNGTELLSGNMRLADLKVTQVGASNVWQVTIKVAFGDNDLLCRTSLHNPTPGSCDIGAHPYPNNGSAVIGNDVKCAFNNGQQFCSVATLITSVEQRI